MKINNLVEAIFAQAVALDQNGGLKNTIYAQDSEIFIMNYDHTVLLSFRLRQSEGRFETPISFKANDYDSNEFDIKDNKIVFYSKKGDFQRKKICGTTELSPAEVKELYQSYMEDLEERPTVLLPRDILELIDNDLSHIEFIGSAGGTLKMIQRNIYSGGVVEIEKNETGMFSEKLANDFGPIAIKTDDFKALFNFQDNLKFSFPKKGKEDFILVKSADMNKRNFTGIIACCLYDEIIQIKEARESKPITRRK